MTRRVILNEPEKWVIVLREPTAWVPSYALSILHQEGHHVAVPTALHKKQLKSGNGTALYASPDPDALADLVAYVARLEEEVRQHSLYKSVGDGFADRQQKAILAAEARVAELEARLAEAEKVIRDIKVEAFQREPVPQLRSPNDGIRGTAFALSSRLGVIERAARAWMEGGK